MNFIFISILLVGTIILTITSPQSVLETFVHGSTKAINLSIRLLAIYTVWLSILNIVQNCGLDKKLQKIMSPIINKLFGNVGYAKSDIAVNITANIFGMGNACVPSGISAMQKLDCGSKYITSAMAMLFILNVTSLEVIPTTVIGLLISHGASNSSNIILPTLIATLSSTICGITLTKLYFKIKKRNAPWVTLFL